MINPNCHHISVCILTYKRPTMLNRCLESMQAQNTSEFILSITVVDNDVSESARETVRKWRRRSSIELRYYVEPEQNISLARNKAIEASSGDLIAFIDDDEFAESTWLRNLYSILVSSRADGVLGPVIPHFDYQPPRWVIKSRLLERPSFVTGTVLRASDTRTGNLLFDRKILEGEINPFDPIFGKIGGEDSDFFIRMIGEGRKFVWCDEARVFETVPPERFQRTYFIKRALLRGVSRAKLHSVSKSGVLKSLVACTLYTAVLPVLFVLGHHLFMRYLIKDCDHIGKLMALCGFDVLKERKF